MNKSKMIVRTKFIDPAKRKSRQPELRQRHFCDPFGRWLNVETINHSLPALFGANNFAAPGTDRCTLPESRTNRRSWRCLPGERHSMRLVCLQLATDLRE